MSDFRGNKEVARQLILDLKCAVCQDVPGNFGVRRNRYVCSKGHLVCEDCKAGDCLCGLKSFNGPVQFVESILEKSQWHYCSHFKHGCKDMFGAQNLEDHQKGCIFREIVCLENKCKKQILFKDYIDHVDSDHKDWNNKATKVDEKTFIVSCSQENISLNILKFEAANFTQLSNVLVYSEPIYVQNLPWKIGVHTRVDENSVKYVGCYTKCDSKSKSTSWSCQAKSELRMINHETPKMTHATSLINLFNSEGHEWGKRNFMEWNKVIEPEAGFLKNNTVTFELEIEADSPKGLNPNSPKICDILTIGTPTIVTTLKTSGAIFFLASQKQCDTLRFRIYLAGSACEAKHYSYTLSIADKTGKLRYFFHGEVFTLDKDDPVRGSVFMMGTEDTKDICDEKSNFDVNITIKNLKKEAMDEDESSGLSD
jgi:hypothetical protein